MERRVFVEDFLRQGSATNTLFGSWWRRFLGFLVPLVLLPLPLYLQTQVAKCAYVVALTVSYWIVEPVGVPVTALIPVFLFPAMGIMDTSVACQAMMRDPVVNYMGVFAIGLAIEESGLHKRIALSCLLAIGTSIRRVTLGVMWVTMLWSMWLNNAAAAMAMVPIVETVLLELEMEPEEEVNAELTVKLVEKKDEKFSTTDSWVSTAQKALIKRAMMLSITYGASLGGIATLNGSEPNFVLKGVLEELFPNHDGPSYSNWMLFSVPTMVACALLGSLFLQVVFLGFGFLRIDGVDPEKRLEMALRKKYKQLGDFKFREFAVFLLLSILVVVWFFRDPKFVTGWVTQVPPSIRIEDATPAVGIALLLFLLPSEPKKFMSSPALLDWKTFQSRMPWGILMLVGSGFVMAEGTKRSGFSAYVSDGIMGLGEMSPGASVFVICLLTSSLTEFLNNMVTTSMVLPVLAEMAQSRNLNPLMFMIPAAIGSSFAFMFPVSQPSNAIVFQRGKMRTLQMMWPGIVMNILCCCVNVFIFNTLGVYVFDLKVVPDWSIARHPELNSTLSLADNGTFPL